MKKYILSIITLIATAQIGLSQLAQSTAQVTNPLQATLYVMVDQTISTNGVLNMSLAVSVPTDGPQPTFVSLLGGTLDLYEPEEFNGRYVYSFNLSGPMNANTFVAGANTAVVTVTFPAVNGPDHMQINDFTGSGASGAYFYFAWAGADLTNYDEMFYPYPGTTPTIVNASGGDSYLELAEALPVTLGRFYAEKYNTRDANLVWKTVNESNASHFVVQRSTDKKNWTSIGQVNAAGFSSTPLDYQYIDTGVYNGRDAQLTVYYRLKMTDRDARFQYSNIETVVFSNGTLASVAYLVYPNPATEGIYIEWDQSTSGQPTQIEMFDASGRLVSVQNVAENSNKEYVNFADNGVTSGIYSVRLLQNDTVLDVRQIIAGSR